MGTLLGTPEKGYRMSTRVPPYCRQRETSRPDRAFVRIDCKKIYLGRYGSPKSKAKYAEVIAEPSEGPCSFVPPNHPTISELILAYLEYAAIYYQ